MKSFLQPILLSVIIYTTIGACSHQKENNHTEAGKEILKLHNLQRKYHFEKDSTALVNQFSDQFISVNKGHVDKPTYSDNLKKYNQYFSSVTFKKWDDITEPLIRFSENGRMAYTIVEKEVVIQYKDQGKTIMEHTDFAWVTIYKKYDTGWKIDCIASTNMPPKKELVE